MKQLICLLAILYCSYEPLYANVPDTPAQFHIYIEDTDVNPPFLYQYPTGEFFIYFTDPNINAIFANYTITQFEKRCPSCRRPYMQRYWTIETDNKFLINELINYDSTLFF